MSIKRRILLLAGSAATAGAILAGAGGAASAAPVHTLDARMNVCVEASGLGVKCAGLSPTTVTLSDTNPVAKTVSVKNGQFEGTMQVKYQMDAAGTVRHQLVFAKLLKNGNLVSGTSNVQATIVKPGSTPSTVSGVGSASGAGATMTDSATTRILS
ncbi:hypothetical protein [Planobispora takensis]|uniref:Secreted protein n=1 Tax=Planobispora takensis TaxID=1367882 RepID=A0A8J3WU11_9ACTN|nr:hypothetical protein [Planobispora takensis]GII02141.1 hypothetical protein Pta02_41490 [Planobispora takensis]